MGDLRNVPLAKLRELFGEKQAQSLFRLSRGIDDRPWDPRPPRKSVGAQIAWGVRFEDTEALRHFVAELTTEALRRLARHGRRGSSLTVKVWKARPDAPHCGGRAPRKPLLPLDANPVVEASAVGAVTSSRAPRSSPRIPALFLRWRPHVQKPGGSARAPALHRHKSVGLESTSVA